MIYVSVKNDEPFERALRRFKKKWEKAGVLREVRSRSYYLKPSEERKIARQNKDFKKADQIREELKKMNVLIDDTSDGTKWTVNDK